MSEEGERVIETYLTLVRRYLPVDIADEVITELEHYIIDSAMERGNGKITEQAAKQTVARFGAPSEVAEEYILSMHPGRVDDIHPESELAERDKMPEAGRMRGISEEIGPKDQTTLYLDAFVKSLYLFPLFCLLAAIGAGTWIVFVFGFEAAIGLCCFTGFLLTQNYRDIHLSEPDTEEWPMSIRVFVMPVNLFPKRSEILFGLDLLATISASITAAYFIFLWKFYFIPSLWLMALVLLVIIRLYLLFEKGEDQRSITFVKRQVLVDFVLLFFINILLGVEFSQRPWRMSTVPGAVILLWYGAFLVFNIISAEQTYWEEYAKEEASPAEIATETELIQEERPRDEEYPREVSERPEEVEIETTMKQPEPSEHREEITYPSGEVVAKAFVLTLLWFVIGIAALVVVVPAYPSILVLVMFQFLPALSIVFSQIPQEVSRDEEERAAEGENEQEHSLFKRLVTLPKNLDQSQNTMLYNIDIVLTFGCAFYVGSFMFAVVAFWNYFFLLAPFLTLLLYRLNKLFDRRKESHFNYRKFGLVDIATLMMGNLTLALISLVPAWWYYGPIAPLYGLSLGLAVYLDIYGVFVLIRLVTTGRAYSAPSEEAPSTQEPADRRALVVSWLKSIGRLTAYTGALVSVTWILAPILLRSGSEFRAYQHTLFGVPVLYVFLPTVILTSLFFMFRLAMKPASDKFGWLGIRGRASAGISLIMSITCITVLFADVRQFVRILQEGIVLISHFYGWSFLLLAGAIYISIIGLYIAAFTHLLADAEDIAHPGSIHSVTLLRITGIGLLLFVAFLSPILFHTGEITLLGFHPVFIVLHLILVPVLVQTALAAEKNTLAKQKKNELESTGERD